jgi:RNA polymerase sigma-70 factor, ECF subfamily
MSSHPGSDAEPDFETWFETSAADMLTVAYFYTGDPKQAEDIAQEAAFKVFKTWDTEEIRRAVFENPGYLRAIIRNCYLDYIKVRSRTNHGEAELDLTRHDRAGIENDREVRLAVLNLEDNERDMIVLRWYGGLTIKEAGTRLGLSASRAYRLHEKAVAHLAELLNENEGEA